MREIVLDTETTGLLAEDRIIEIGCVELINGIVTGETFHSFVNPEGRKVNPRAFEVHGIPDEFLLDKPTFKEIYDALIDFIGSDTLVIHNAPFDTKMISRELKRMDEQEITNPIVDTLVIARRKYPGSRVRLDDLCKKFQIDLSSRQNAHGAIVDCKLLAQVYFALCPRKINLIQEQGKQEIKVAVQYNVSDFNVNLTPLISEEEQGAHDKIMEKLQRNTQPKR